MRDDEVNMRAFLVPLLAMTALAALSPQASAWQQDRFLVTFWCPPPATDEALSAVAAEGYNLTWAAPDKLDVVAKHGLKALVQDGLLDPTALDNPTRRADLDAMISKVKDHPAVEGYFITDEPGSGAFPGLGRLVAFIRERDPKHLAYINLFPTYANEEQLGVTADEAERQRVGIPLNFAGVGDYKKAILAYNEYLRQFVQVVKPELVSYDHYHFLKNNVDGGQYFLNLGLVREAAKSAGLPFLNIIQACTIEPSWRLVNKDELRWLVYTTIAYGGRGISYFLYWGPASYGGLYQEGVRMPLALDVAAINAELKTIGPEMMKLDSVGVYHTDPAPVGGVLIPSDSPVKIVNGGQFVLGLFSIAGKTDTFMIVNRDYRGNASAKVLLPESVRALKEFDRKSGSWKTYTSVTPGNPVTIGLDPGDGRLMKMVTR